MRLANSDMEAEDRVSSLSTYNSVLENSYGANVFFMGFHKTDELMYFIGLLKQAHLTRTSRRSRFTQAAASAPATI